MKENKDINTSKEIFIKYLRLEFNEWLNKDNEVADKFVFLSEKYPKIFNSMLFDFLKNK